MELKDGMIVIAPVSSWNPNGKQYLTQGKEYIAENVDCDEIDCGFEIKDDNNKTRYCLLNGCAHLSDENWIIKN